MNTVSILNRNNHLALALMVGSLVVTTKNYAIEHQIAPMNPKRDFLIRVNRKDFRAKLASGNIPQPLSTKKLPAIQRNFVAGLVACFDWEKFAYERQRRQQEITDLTNLYKQNTWNFINLLKLNNAEADFNTFQRDAIRTADKRSKLLNGSAEGGVAYLQGLKSNPQCSPEETAALDERISHLTITKLSKAKIRLIRDAAADSAY
jgi:hypothetical protein